MNIFRKVPFALAMLLWEIGSGPIPPAEARQELETQQNPAGLQTKDQFQFKDENGGKGITKDGNVFSFHTYSSNDGVKLLTYIETLASVELAKRALDEKLKEASSVVSRGPKLEKSGKRIGERVVLTIERKTQGEAESQSFVCWTTGSSLHWIQSKSLKHALAFEKTLER